MIRVGRTEQGLADWGFWWGFLFGLLVAFVFLGRNQDMALGKKIKKKCTNRRSTPDLDSQMSVSCKMLFYLLEIRYCPGIFCSACQPPSHSLLEHQLSKVNARALEVPFSP